MSAKRNLRLITPYLVCSLEGVSHGIYLLWLTVHKGISPFAAATAIAAGDLALLVLEVPTGVFADRLGARRSLLLGSACQVLGLVALLAGRLARRRWWSPRWPSRSATRSATAPTRRWSTDRAPRSARPASFGRRFARAQAWALAAMVGLTALGGWIAEHAGFDAAWALEVALAVAGLALAWAMTELPAAPDEPDGRRGGRGRARSSPGCAARVPWSLIVPATIVGTLGVDRRAPGADDAARGRRRAGSSRS